jgi:hypothetical protein
LNVPLGHEVQDELAGVKEYVPAAHSVQDVFEVAPNAELLVPAGHAWQADRPVSLPKYPTGQTEHAKPPLEE